MKKLKNIFQFRSLLIIVTVIYVLLFIIFFDFKSKFLGNETRIEGRVITKKINGDKLTLLIKSKEKIIVYYYFKNEKEKKDFNLNYNDLIIIEGSIKNVNNNTIFNTFNYKKYLKYNNMYYCFNAKNITLKKKNNNIFYSFKEFLEKRINKLKTKDYVKLFLFGEKDYLDNEVYNSYKNLNIIHLLVISSMHFYLLLFFINKIRINKILKKIIFIVVLLFFMFLSNYSISIVRVFFCYILKMIMKVLKKNISNFNILIIVICILLFINPLFIFNIGFILSSLISFSILFFKDYYRYNRIVNNFIISTISFLVSLPVIINNYYCINMISSILSVILSSYVLYLLFPLSIITLLFPFIDNIYLIFITIFEKICKFIDNDYFIISFSKIPLLLVMFYYVIIFVKNKKIKILLPLFIIFFYFFNYNSYDIKVYYIDVGQGDSSLIRINSRNILIDTGGHIETQKEKWQQQNNMNTFIHNIIYFFNSVGVKKIDYLVLSHGDYDHMGEAINLVNNFKVEKVIFNCGPFNDLEKELIKVLDKKKIKYYSCVKELNVDNNKLYFLQTKEYDNENDNSNVIYTELDGYKFMFMGDASTTTERKIIENYNLPDIDVLKVGHHGSKTSSSNEFIDEIKPKYSIISVGKKNRYGHPNKEVLNNLEQSKIYRTDQDGSIMFKIKNNKLKIETCSP